MSIIDDIILLVAAVARASSAGIMSAVVKSARRACLVTGLLITALSLLIGALGLMIAALFIGLTPYLGAHWAAMIAAAAALMGCGLFAMIALLISNRR